MRKADLSPYDFGLAEAKTGIERYRVLFTTHQTAVAAGVNVDYSGIDSVDLEIPDASKSIPLTQYNDFKGCVFSINNTSQDAYLFEKRTMGKRIIIDKRLLDSGDFRTEDSLNRGKCLLLIEDENPWVANRKGYDYGHKRKDILLIENGIAKNSVTMPYNNAYSKPVSSFICLDDDPLVIKNLTIDRNPGCTRLTHVVLITGQDDVQITNVTIHTPSNTLTADRGIRIQNCTNQGSRPRPSM